MSNPNNNAGAAPSVSPGQPPTQGTLHASTGTGGTKGHTMEWIHTTSRSKPSTVRLRDVMKKHVSRVISVTPLELALQVRNGENRWLDKMARKHSFRWRHSAPPEASAIYQAACGREMIGRPLLTHHTRACYACQRVRDPNYKRQARKSAPAEAATTAPLQAPVDTVDTVIDGPSPMETLITGLEARERRAFAIAEACGAALKALQAVEASDAALKELQAQLDADRKRLTAFIAAEGGPQ